MSPITVERRPGGLVFVGGLLGHSAVAEELAALLLDPDARDLALKVDAAGDVFRDAPGDLVAAAAYYGAVDALAAFLSGATFVFHPADLENLAAAVSERRAVMAA